MGPRTSCGVKTMDTNIVFKRVLSADYEQIKSNIRLVNVFLMMDGTRSVKTIASEYNYEIDDLISMVDQIEKMGLIIPVDGAEIKSYIAPSKGSFVKLPAEFHTGIEAVDKQHQRLVEMVTQLNMARKASYGDRSKKRQAVGNVIAEMIDYTLSHFAFEESLMEDAQYKFFHAHKRIHELFVNRASEYKNRFEADEDIVDELYEVLHRWLFNHIRNDDKAFAPSVKSRLKALNSSNRNWLKSLLKRCFS
jgi:hemerythrin